MIKKRMKAVQSRQKAYADRRHWPLKFSISDKVFLKVFPTKDMISINRKSKLSPRFIGPFEILERIRLVAYRLALAPEMGGIHDVVHISQLKKYIPDRNRVIPYRPLQIQDDLTYTEKPIQILDHKVKKLRDKSISLLKISWKSQLVEEFTWVPEEEMPNNYPHLFLGTLSFEDETSLTRVEL